MKTIPSDSLLQRQLYPSPQSRLLLNDLSGIQVGPLLEVPAHPQIQIAPSSILMLRTRFSPPPVTVFPSWRLLVWRGKSTLSSLSHPFRSLLTASPTGSPICYNGRYGNAPLTNITIIQIVSRKDMRNWRPMIFLCKLSRYAMYRLILGCPLAPDSTQFFFPFFMGFLPSPYRPVSRSKEYLFPLVARDILPRTYDASQRFRKCVFFRRRSPKPFIVLIFASEQSPVPQQLLNRNF